MHGPSFYNKKLSNRPYVVLELKLSCFMLGHVELGQMNKFILKVGCVCNFIFHKNRFSLHKAKNKSEEYVL